MVYETQRSSGTGGQRAASVRAAVTVLALAVAACGNTTSARGDAASDVREEGDLNFPRSTLCDQLADGGVVTGVTFCPLNAAEGDRCWMLPPNAGMRGYCVGVGTSSGGALAAYERNHRVPKLCMVGPPGRPALCAQYSPGRPVDEPNNSCRPEGQTECVRFDPPDSGHLWACVPYHCD